MTELAKSVLEMTMHYLGPASQIFLERQTKRHMNGLVFNTLEKEHLPGLARWVLISAGLLIEKPLAAELSRKIEGLND